MTNDNVIELPTTEWEETEEVSVPTPQFHTVLEVWREVLKPAEAERTKRVTPQWANRIVGAYQGITFADMEGFRDLYFGRLGELNQILLDEIASDEDCLTYATAEEDLENNHGHYKALLFNWQLHFMGWELAWECTSATAEIELAVISEIHKMFFGDTGITPFLESIRFEFTDADQHELTAALEALRDGGDGE
jgi:hypothetical protein